MSDILADAVGGKLRVPHFQTGLRWRDEHVVALFDSIVRGFPIGSLLLWRREAKGERLRFGPLQIDGPARGDASYIVDGQQRVTALVGALLHPDARPCGDTYAVWVDLRDSRFRVVRDEPLETEIPVRLFGERRRLQRWAKDASFGEETDAYVDRAFTLEEAIIRYTLPVYSVSDTSVEVLRLIFSRVNSSGVSLQENQVFEALHGSEATAKPIADLAVDLAQQTGFGPLNEKWLLRCVKAVAGLDERRKFDEHNPPGETLLRDTLTALRHAVSFLQRDALFPHSSVLPYRFPLIILARFFHLFPQPHPRSRTLLARWVWRGALSKQHGGSSRAAVAANLSELGADEHASIQGLLARVEKSTPIPSAAERWSGHAAVTRLYAAALLSLEPVDLRTEEPPTAARIQARLTELSLGKAFTQLVDSRTIAARGWIERALVEALLDAPEDILRTHCLDAQTVDLLESDTNAFVEARATRLEDALRRLVARLAAPDADDRDPLEVILARAG